MGLRGPIPRGEMLGINNQLRAAQIAADGVVAGAASPQSDGYRAGMEPTIGPYRCLREWPTMGA